MLQLVPVGHEGVETGGLCQPGAGIAGAEGAGLRPAVGQGAPDDGAALVPLPAAAAGAALLHPVHGTQGAAQPAQGERRVAPPVIPHDGSFLRSRANRLHSRQAEAKLCPVNIQHRGLMDMRSKVPSRQLTRMAR